MRKLARMAIRMSMYPAFGLLALLCCSLVVTNAHAQDDPFDNAGVDTDLATEPAPVATATAGAVKVDVAERNAAVLSLREYPPKTPREYARAIMLMGRIRRWDQVAYWLDEVSKLNLSMSIASEMTSEVGTQAFLAIETNAESLTPKQLQTVRKIVDLSNALATDSKTLRNQVNRLGSAVKSERIQAFRALQSGGNAAITAVINSVMAENAAVPSATLQEAYSLLGPNTKSAWHAAMTTPHADARERLIALVQSHVQSSMAPELAASLWDSKLSDAVKQSLQQAIRNQAKSVPDASRVHRHVMDQMNVALFDFDKSRFSDDPQIHTMWALAPDGRSVTQSNVSTEFLDLSRAAQLAIASLRAGAQSDIDSALAAAVVVEHATRVLAMDGKLALDSVVPESLRDGYEFNCLVFDASEKLHLDGAKAFSVQQLSRWATSIMPVPVRERLVAGCKSGCPLVRYSAAAALAKAHETAASDGGPVSASDPSLAIDEAGFGGKHRVEQVLDEMRHLEASPLALVIGGNAALRTHAVGLIEKFSYRTVEASNANMALEQFRLNRPIEAVWIVDHLREMDLGQLVQRIRSVPSGSTVPIALLADSLSTGEHAVAGVDRRLVMGSVPQQSEGMADIVRRMLMVNDSPKIDAASRIAWRDAAQYRFDKVNSQRLVLEKKAPSERLADSSRAQTQLLQIAADNSVSVLKREQASQIFVQSVRQFGLLISTDTANAQYDVYNERGSKDPIIRNVMGRILDAIEAGNGSRPWTEVAP